jgi:hypothetical protein
VLMKRTIASAGLAMLPKNGRVHKLDESALFNALVDKFFHQIETGRWSMCDARSITDKIYDARRGAPTDRAQKFGRGRRYKHPARAQSDNVARHRP